MAYSAVVISLFVCVCACVCIYIYIYIYNYAPVNGAFRSKPLGSPAKKAGSCISCGKK